MTYLGEEVDLYPKNLTSELGYHETKFKYN